jgi:uncharacterized protein YbaA (DUF1428 family)
MSQYVDGFVIPIKKKNLSEYKKMALAGAKAWMKHGALQYFECVADDLYPDMQGMKTIGFKGMTKLKKDETVLYSFIIYKSRAHRDSVNKKVMAEFSKDPKAKEMKMPFDMKRMAYAGFKTIVRK